MWRCAPILFFLISFSSRAQPLDSVQSQYVESFHEYFLLWPLLKQRSTQLEIRRADNRNQALTFKPNSAFTGGLGMYLFELGIEVTFAIPIQEKKTALYGTSHAFDLQVNALSRHWGADVFYQKYQGFYLQDPNIITAAGTPLPQRPDMVTRNFGLNGIYFFNRDKFAYRAVYNFAEKQLKSAGSFLVAGSINAFHLKTDSVLYGNKYEPIFGADADVKEYSTTSISVAPGYSYTLVAGSFFLNGSLSLGPALHFVNYKVNDVEGQTQKLNSFSDIRVALGYNGKRFFSGVTFVSQSRYVRFNDVQLTSSSSTFRMLVGYRFREVGILKKRAIDLFKRRP